VLRGGSWSNKLGNARCCVLFAESKRQLWDWKAAIVERLARLRLTIHETRAQVVPVEAGIPWLGFVVFPNHRLVKVRKVRQATRRLHGRLADYHAGRLSFAELEASILGWTHHVAHADSSGLRRNMFDGLAIRTADHRSAMARKG